MPAIDLVFKRPFKTGNPVDLVFGDDGEGSGIPDAALVIAARMPGLRARAAVHVRKDLVGAARMPVCAARVRCATTQTRLGQLPRRWQCSRSMPFRFRWSAPVVGIRLWLALVAGWLRLQRLNHCGWSATRPGRRLGAKG